MDASGDDDRIEQVAARLGEVLEGRWTLDALVGLGGSAAVYAARDGDERVAVKVLHPELSRSQTATDRFRREAEALRSAKHEAVPRVRGEGVTADGCAFLVMELLEGESVDARRRRFGGKLPPAEVVQVAMVVLDVLAAVHARGILHRDIKPRNVLWLDDGTVRLIDFGIAKVVREGAGDTPTRTGTLPGSLAFMSPEHALGVPSELDARTDLWSLGATMFVLLSGRPVHESQTDVEALARAASQEARSLGVVVSGLPPPLVSLVDRALAFDRRERFPSAAAMRDALLALGSSAGAGAPRKTRRAHGVVGALVVTLAGAMLLGASGASQRPASATEASPSPGVVDEAASVRPVASPAERADAPAKDRVTEPPASAALLPRDVPSSRLARPRALPGATSSALPATSSPSEATAARPAPSDAPASRRCDPPFYVDPGTGTRRVKPGC
jgi:tRNA A-37 threonylcarbamoyl transferase component Bud32